MEILAAVLGNPYLLGACLATLVAAICVVLVAVLRGQEVSFWPPKIGPKAAVSNSPTKVATDMSPKLPDSHTRSPDNQAKLQAAAFCYRKVDGKIEVLLVQTSGRRWTFPKGRIHSSADNWRVAETNALEEAGASGWIDRTPFCQYRHWKQELKVNEGDEWLVDIFFLHVDKQVNPIEKHRYPTWFSIPKANEALCADRRHEYGLECVAVLAKAGRLLESR